MTDVSIKSNDYEQFVEKLRRLRDRHEEPKTLTLCLVEAYRMSDRHTHARQELEYLLAGRPDDMDVLQLMVNLAVSEKDWRTAVSFQQQIVALDGSRDNLLSLSQFHMQGGDHDQATEVWKDILQETGDATPIVNVVDSRLRQGKFNEALKLAEWALEIAPTNWRLLYRCGYAQFTLQHYDDADQYFSKFQAVVEPHVSRTPSQRNRRSSRGYSVSMFRVPYAARSGQSMVLATSPSLIRRLPAFQEIYAELNGGDMCVIPLPDFISAILGAPTQPAHVCMADMNADGKRNGNDIQKYVDAVLTP